MAAAKKKPTKGKPKTKATTQPARGRGCPTDYRPEYAEIARGMCKLGATDVQLAAHFQVTMQTVLNWQSRYPEFFEALKVGKGEFDDKVVRSLAQRAVGYSYDAEKIFQHQGSIVRAKTVEHVPPDPGAAKLWLCNRRPKEWRDTSRVEVTGQDGEPLIDTRELARALIERTRMQLEHLPPEPIKLKPFKKDES